MTPGSNSESNLGSTAGGTSGSDPVLEAKALRKVYARKGGDDLVAVDGISFKLGRGECLGIVGESGSGKSTTAKMLTRLADATSGTFEVEGEDLTWSKGRDLKRLYSKVQMVFQSPSSSFDPRRTLGDGIGESLVNRGMKRREADQRVVGLLERCGLTADFAKRYPHQVSGGQCQRAAIARALAINPKVLICDEATSSLDVTIQKQVIDLLGELRRSGDISCLFICHDLALVQDFCDNVLVMQRGKVVESGATEQVLGDPKHEYTQTLLDACFLE